MPGVIDILSNRMLDQLKHTLDSGFTITQYEPDVTDTVEAWHETHYGIAYAISEGRVVGMSPALLPDENSPGVNNELSMSRYLS